MNHPLKQKNCRKSHQKNEIGFNEDDFIDKNPTPKMELLKVNYVNFGKPTIENNRIKKTEDYKLKYSVYKKHNSLDTKSLADKKIIDEKLKYVNGDEITNLKNKKTIFFDPTKKKESKIDENIQFYFDNKSYERYVDNQLYGVFDDIKEYLSSVSSDEFENKSNSWDYRKNKETIEEMKPKLPPKISRQKSLSDVAKISQMFMEVKRDSVNEKTKMFENLESKCSCEHKKVKEKSKNSKKKPQVTDNNVNVHNKIKKIFEIQQPPQNGFKNNGLSCRIVSEMEKQKTKKEIANTCGFKNCKFADCPMSSSSSTSSCSSSPIDETLFNNKLNISSAEIKYKSKTQIELKTDKKKEFLEEAITAPIIINLKEKIINNNLTSEKFGENKKSKNSDKIMLNKNLNNLLELSNKKTDNCVKIFISNSPVEPLAKTRYSISSQASTSSSSESDYGYYDQVTEIVNSKEDEIVKSVLLDCPIKLGCDGAIFWNDCYYYDEQACGKCSVKNKKDTTGKKYICVCATGKVYNFITRNSF